MAKYVADFESALSLFEFADDQDRADEWVVRGWKWVAARDGAMSIYHVQKTLSGIGHWTKSCPTLFAAVDREALKIARKVFEEVFPNSENMRHAVAHHGEFAERRKRKGSDGTDKDYEGEGISIRNVQDIELDMLDNSRYTITYEGNVISYDLSTKSYTALLDVLYAFYGAFATASHLQ